MRKNDIIAGTDYFSGEGRSYLYATRHIQVVENEVYHQASILSCPRDAIRADEAYRVAHLASSLCAAFPNDTAPREASVARAAVTDAERAAQKAWFKADPMRMFAKGDVSSRYSTSGIMCRAYNSEGVLSDAIILIPRKDIRSTWDEYVKQERANAALREVNDAKKVELTALRAQQHEVILPALKALFKDSGVPAPYVSSYDREVTFNYEQVLVLLNAVPAPEEATA